jgi:hypothetical protein
MTLTLLTALSVIALRLALYFSGRPVEGTEFMLVHFLAVVTLVFFAGHRLLLRDRRAGFPDLLREGFRNAAVYALLMMVFLWMHYNWLEADLFTQKIDERVAMGVAEGQPEELIRERMERFFTPFNYATITFFALLITGAFQAFLIGLVHHKFLRRFRP